MMRGTKEFEKKEKKILTFSTQNSFLFTKGNKMSPIFLVALNREYLGGKPQDLYSFTSLSIFRRGHLQSSIQDNLKSHAQVRQGALPRYLPGL
jgi:hypothetical protein